VFLRTYEQGLEDRITTVAAAIAFYGFLALFPAIAALVSIYGLVADPSTIRDHLFQLSFLLPPEAFSIIDDQIKRVVAEGQQQLGIKFLFGLVLSIWSANAGMKGLIDGLNVAYEEAEKRSFIRLNLISLAITMVALTGVIALVGLLVILPEFLNGSFSQFISTGLAVVRWPATFALVAIGLSLLFRFGPSREAPQWRWLSWGAVAASIIVVVISVALSWYLTNFADYTKTYGSLGAVVGLLIWMWLSSCAILIGAELNAEMEHQTRRDTTSGAPKPMGSRGAKMADTIGRSTN
jgi:membrane protein